MLFITSKILTMKLFNLISATTFAIMGAIMLVAGFFNPIHFVFGAACFAIVCVAIFDDTDGESIINVLKQRNHERDL